MVIPEGAAPPDHDFMPSWLYGDAYYEGQRVLVKYLKEYEGVRLEDAIGGTPVSNDAGECYLIESSSDFPLGKIDRESARKALLSNLRLLRGIGPGTEAKLKKAGYHTIEDLLAHKRWRAQARRLLGIIDSGDACRIQEEVWHWLPRSHPLNLHITAFTNVEQLVALDIETMGLFSRPIILFGAAFTKGEKIITRQYLARGVEEEAAAIEEFCSLVESSPLVSYNGRSFDVPYINQRRVYYGLGGGLQNVHFDLLPLARRAFRHKLPDARLTTVEKYLFGQERKDDVPGALVPEFYEEYLHTKNPGPLIPIVEHNRNDLATLARLYSKLCEDCNGSG
ncbi:putative exonuclease [Methanocella conradii HZ254]|uniref:Exonuclease n=1 Tax=Methanocella conradii (strain DSM 24694 / JCM 17849 / CGMCC 1.5162 / HZ254) TaxID=1041930 RepID=H8I7P4_METCZ|nr:ribonuclease H-like domain-containing protein [Methanocella conradii]AFC99879.1 putative exonuclease [Methanocella conradii HZ254]